MRKLLFLLLMLSVMVSCQDNEIASPKNTGDRNVQSHVEASPKGERVMLQNGVAYTLASYVPEEFYVPNMNSLLAVNYATGTYYMLNPDMPYMYHIASTGGFIYGILNDNLYKINPSTGVFSIMDPGWTNAEAIAAGKAGAFPVKRYVFGVVDGNLWRIDVSNNASTLMGTDWGGTKAMTMGNGHVYIAHGDTLYAVNAVTGSVAVLDPSGFNDTKTMAFYNNHIYSIRGQYLYKTFHNGGTSAVGNIPIAQYNYAKGLTNYGSNLFCIGASSAVAQLNKTILQIDPTWGTVTYPYGNGGWAGSFTMTALQQ